MIPALLSGLLLSILAAADNARTGRQPPKMVALIIIFVVLIAAIIRFAPPESF